MGFVQNLVYLNFWNCVVFSYEHFSDSRLAKVEVCGIVYVKKPTMICLLKVGIPYLTRRIVIEVSLSSWKGSGMIGPWVILTKISKYYLTYSLSYVEKTNSAKLKQKMWNLFWGFFRYEKGLKTLYLFISKVLQILQKCWHYDSKGKTVNPVFLDTTKLRIW